MEPPSMIKVELVLFIHIYIYRGFHIVFSSINMFFLLDFITTYSPYQGWCKKSISGWRVPLPTNLAPESNKYVGENMIEKINPHF